MKRLLAVFLAVAAVANCIDFPQYQLEASAVEGQVSAETDTTDGTVPGQGQTVEDVPDEDQETIDPNETEPQEPEDQEQTDPEEEQQTDEEKEHSQDETMPEEGPSAEASPETMPQEELTGMQVIQVEGLRYNYSAAASTNIPHTVGELVQGKVYVVATYDDVLALQELSRQSTLKGCIFEFAKLNSNVNTWDLTNIGFSGLGSEEYPFQGTLQEYYTSGTSFKMNCPMFQYLGSGATVTNFDITLTNASSGMADYLVATDDTPVHYNNVTLKGVVTNSNAAKNDGAAGALYGTVVNRKADGSTYNLVIDGSGISLKGVSVTGLIAGGYAGQVKENVAVKVSNASNLASAINCDSRYSAVALGGIIGKLDTGSSFEVMKDITISNSVGYNGVRYSVNAQSTGGLIGVSNGAAVTSRYHVTKDSPIYLQGGVAGGYIGRVVDSQVTITAFTLANHVKTSISSVDKSSTAGGVVGIYETTAAGNGAYLDISKVGINGYQVAGSDDDDYTKNRTNQVIMGGVVGSIQGDSVRIHDLSYQDSAYPFCPAMGYDGYDTGAQINQSTSACTGGIAGEVQGKNIEFYDLTLSFDRSGNHKIGGKCLGGLAGKVGENTKMRATDITIAEMYVNATAENGQETIIPEYAGGLFGYVDKGCIISLGAKDDSRGWDGIIDLSGIPYTQGAATVAGFRFTKARGYIAAVQEESLIYLETDAEYKKNNTAADWGNSAWTEEYFGTKKNYTLDDIGTYGGVYRNIKEGDSSVIDYGRSYGNEVTGTLAKDGSSYVISGDADALRLAVALNTFDSSDSDYRLRFAAGCFDAGTTGKTLLDADYKLTSDLDFSKTGIFSLVRNDSDTAYPFTGTLTGQKEGENPKITLHTATFQEYAGLFPTVENAEFKDLTLTGTLYYAGEAGSLACRARKSLTLDNVNVTTTMRTASYVESVNNVSCYGGYVAAYDLGSGIFTCRNVTIAPEISNIRSQQIVGGLAGFVKTDVSEPAVENILISNAVVSAELYADSKFMDNAGSWIFQARMSGLIANIARTAWTNQHNWAGVENFVDNATYAKVHLTDIVVDHAVIDASAIAKTQGNVRVTGGFLGYQWDNVEVKVDGDTGVQVTGDSTIQSRGHVGGLFTTFSGKLDFNTRIDLDRMTMNDCQSSKENFSGLLVSDGRYAIITLTAANYTINDVTVTGYSNFDEMVGVNLQVANNQVNYNNASVGAEYAQGGILNILMPEYKNMTTSYTSYENQKVTQENKNTRYYYNLFTEDYEPVRLIANNTAQLDSEEDLMLWHLYEFTGGSNGKLGRFFKNWFVDDASSDPKTMNGNGTWKLDGVFDMAGYSYYPTRVTGGRYEGTPGTVIKLYADVITAGENTHGVTCDKRIPSSWKSQQYMIHAGLFLNSSGFTVQNIAFQGAGAYLGASSGVLCAGNLSGTVTIKDITLDGVVIHGYGKDCAGLMLGKVLGEKNSNTRLTMSGIETTNYAPDKLAAGALIGKVGSSTATNFKVTMTDMKLDYRKGDTPFWYASMICEYEYAGENSIAGSEACKLVLYTFTAQDVIDGNVTYGSEMKDGVNYYDKDRDPSDDMDPLNVAIQEAEENYMPYVHHRTSTSRYMFVNPRNGDITKGCGTYEDPYIIENSRQFMNLYLYLTGSSAYDDLFEMSGVTGTDTEDHRWKVNLLGNGTEDGRCDVDGTVVTSHTTAIYGDDTQQFPTRDEMRTAYYMVTADLDLTTVQDMNDQAWQTDFVGLGTERYPFAGVLLGEKNSEGNYPSIKLPATTNSVENYGLIQYMKGGVVKDLVVTGPGDKILVKQSGNGAGVAAVILGGDNIIDNVQVDLEITMSNGSTGMAATGAYVGTLRTGGLILRNLKQENIAGYSIHINGIGDPDVVANAFASGTPGIYRKNCQIIGWVEDGYVLGYLSGDQKKDQALLECSELGMTGDAAKIPLSYSFPIINGAYLDDGFNDMTEGGKIRVSGSAADGYVVTMYNARQLETVTLGFNSNAFSIYDSGVLQAGGTNAYDALATCRKAQYTDVGCGYAEVHGASVPEDYTAAVQQDDGKSHYPYIYQKYINWTDVGGYETTLNSQTTGSGSTAVTATLSYLNWTQNDGNSYAVKNGDVLTTYQLCTDETKGGSKDYDLSVYGRSFRGIGGLYHTAYSAFKANFNGGDANVIIDMDRDWDSGVTVTGMFNGLTTTREGSDDGNSGFTIQDLNIKNSHFKNGNAGAVGGALTGYMKGIWNIQDVTLVRDQNNANADLDIQSHTGGLVGVIRYYSINAPEKDIQQIRFVNCGVQGTSGAPVQIHAEGHVGGVAGFVDGYDHSSTNSYFGAIDLLDCKVSYADIETSGGNAGGYIGRAGYSFKNRTSSCGRSVGTVFIHGTAVGDSYPVAVEHSRIRVDNSSSSYYAAGGLVGVDSGCISSGDGYGLKVEGVVLDGITVSSNTKDHTDNSFVNSGIGGVVGGVWADHLTAAHVQIKNSEIGGEDTNIRQPAGGLVGEVFSNRMTVEDITVSDTTITSYGGPVSGVVAGNRVIGPLTVQGITLDRDTIWSATAAAGGVVGWNMDKATESNISDIWVSGSKIYAGCSKNASGKMVVSATSGTACAGGVLGYSNQYVPQWNLTNVVLGKDSEVAGYHAGGVIGNISGSTAITMKGFICVGATPQMTDGTVTGYVMDTEESLVYSKYRCGGVIGNDETTQEGKYPAAVRVYHTRVGSCGNAGGNTSMAGGLVGYVRAHDTTWDDVEVKKCTFAVTNTGNAIQAAAGSLWAMTQDRTQKIYHPIISDNSTGYVKDYTQMESIDAFRTMPDGNLGLVHSGKKNDIQRWDAVENGLSEENVGFYSYGLGNYIGSYRGGVIYILRPELSFGETYSGNRPVIDVGNSSGSKAADYDTEHGYGFPYNYRQNVHIVYFDPDDPAADKSSLAADYLSSGLMAKSVSNGSTAEEEYLFSSLDTFGGAYQDANNTGAGFLSDYRLNIPVGGMKVISPYPVTDTNTYYDMPDSNPDNPKKYIKDLNQVQCLYADGISAQNLLESMLDILTNAGGSNASGITTITVVSAKITKEGKIVENPGRKSSVEVSGGKVQYRAFSADEYLDDESYTITLLIYHYGWTGADGQHKSETIYIPVFVVERISMFNDLHILEGEQYSLARAKDASVSYQGQVTVAHDSTYTLFSELAYSSVREKNAYKNFEVAKKLKLWKQQTDYSWAEDDIPAGLQFTLVDVSTGKPYYYTSTGSETEIPFTDFVDKDGNPYQYQTIGSLDTTQNGFKYGGTLQAADENFGLEQFFIYVEPSDTADITNSIFKWSISTDATASNISNFLDQSDDYSEIEVTWMPGLDISFDEKETDATGNVTVLQTTADVKEGSAINQDEKVTVTAAINIMADQEYWNQKSAASSRFIDSENNGKYLDVAVYLIDKSTQEYVTLPPGTYLRLNGDSSGFPTISQSVTYTYQQWGLSFPLAELKENVQGWDQTITGSDGVQTYPNTFTLEMDFSAADIDDYVGNSYEVYLELRRTSDPAYPLEGSKLDSYSEEVKSYGNKELATTVEVSDIKTLGINTYKESTSTYTIPFTTKLDFANMIYNEADIATCASSDYLITYRIKKKIPAGTDEQGNPLYEYLTVGSAENSQITEDGKPVSGLLADDQLSLKLTNAGEGEGAELLFQDEYGPDDSTEPVYQMIKRFTKSDIKQGTDGVDYLLTWDLELTVNTTDIEDFDLSNYMVEVTILPFEPSLAASDETVSITIDGKERNIPKNDQGTSLTDYYIFTIGKLKTDL